MLKDKVINSNFGIESVRKWSWAKDNGVEVNLLKTEFVLLMRKCIVTISRPPRREVNDYTNNVS